MTRGSIWSEYVCITLNDWTWERGSISCNLHHLCSGPRILGSVWNLQFAHQPTLRKNSVTASSFITLHIVQPRDIAQFFSWSADAVTSGPPLVFPSAFVTLTLVPAAASWGAVAAATSGNSSTTAVVLFPMLLLPSRRARLSSSFVFHELPAFR